MMARSYDPLREEDAPVPRDFEEQVTGVFDAALLQSLPCPDPDPEPTTDVHQVPFWLEAPSGVSPKIKKIRLPWTTFLVSFVLTLPFAMLLVVFLLN